MPSACRCRPSWAAGCCPDCELRKGERGVSTGADTKANTRAWSSASGLLERLQRRVALEALRESGCSLGTEPLSRRLRAEEVDGW